MNKLLTSALLIAATLLPLTSWAENYKLWYNEPARVWTDALPVGNGRLGAMVFGIPQMERLQLNEETIWTGQPNTNYNTEAREWIPRIQQMIFSGQYAEAERAANDHVMALKTNCGMAYETFGDLSIAQAGTDGYTNYRRELSLDSAIQTTTFTAHGTKFCREVVTPIGGSAIMIKLTASRPGSITFTATLSTPHPDPIIKSEADEVTLLGVAQKLENQKGKIKFMGRMAAQAKGGTVSSDDGVLSVSGADEAVIYVAIATNFTNYKEIADDEAKKSEQQLRQAMATGFDAAKQKHIDAYKAQFGRVSLSLGTDLYAGEPTDERLIKFKNRDDGHLVATYFQFGRYLLISSSQPGTQAATLQGIWNDKLFPSWDSKYTVNINTEMNYWPSETTNLQELNGPLFQLISDVSHTGHETAQKMYGKDGWVLHHNTDIWRVTGAIDHAPSGMWMTAGAWFSAHLWQHYLFTGDREFLKRAYPIMKGAARFLDEMLVEEPTSHWLVVCPSVSPENSHPAGKGKSAMSAGTTMDNTLVRELFHELTAAQRILGIDTDSTEYYTARARRMPPMQIGRWGQLQEWMQDWDDPNDTHRHVSHLYGLFPGQTISPRLTPTLADAARTSLIHRGDPSTGWSMGWKVCLWARLLDGNHAYKLIHNQLSLTDDRFLAYGTNKKSGGTYRNLFDAHPPFQIDGNFGCTAGIAEMLVQSHDGAVAVLPAIPDVWKNGEVKGLLTRGGFEIADLKWQNGRITRLVVKSRLGGNLRLRSPQKIAGLKKAKGQNPNPLMQTQPQAELLNHSEVKLGTFQLPQTWLYDIATRPGQELTLIK